MGADPAALEQTASERPGQHRVSGERLRRGSAETGDPAQRTTAQKKRLPQAGRRKRKISCGTCYSQDALSPYRERLLFHNR